MGDKLAEMEEKYDLNKDAEGFGEEGESDGETLNEEEETGGEEFGEDVI